MSAGLPRGIHVAFTPWKVGWVLWLLLLGGCLWPAPYEEAPAMDDQPPRVEAIFPDLTRPPLPTLNPSPNCPPATFKARIQDPDPNDTVYWRVFLDYTRTDGRPNAHDPQTHEVTNTATRPATVAFDVVADDFPGSVPFDASLNPHTVEIVVADRPFDPTSAPDGRAVSAGGYTASVLWPVVLAENAPCNTTGSSP